MIGPVRLRGSFEYRCKGIGTSCKVVVGRSSTTGQQVDSNGAFMSDGSWMEPLGSLDGMIGPAVESVHNVRGGPLIDCHNLRLRRRQALDRGPKPVLDVRPTRYATVGGAGTRRSDRLSRAVRFESLAGAGRREQPGRRLR